MEKKKYPPGSSRKRCPVCKVDRTYAGPICPPCTQHFEVKPNGKIGRISKIVESVVAENPNENLQVMLKKITDKLGK